MVFIALPTEVRLQLSLHDALPISLAAAAAVTVVLLVSHNWAVLGAVTVWLAAAALFARHGDRGVLKIGLVLSAVLGVGLLDRKSTRLNSSHANISYAVFCLKNKNK